MFYYYDPTYILILIGAIVALYAQIKVSTTYAKWQKVPSSTRMTGAQIARQILDNNGCQDVRIEAINGKLTDHYVSPVVMSGFVPDLLKSISMVSDGFEVIGAGQCGKGYKEWVRVSDGGPNLKVRVKLG